MARPLILVVDDDILVRINTAMTFEDAGFDVLEARHAEDALTIMKQRRDIQLVFTDVQMPGQLDGVDLAVWILRHAPHMKVIITSGFKVINLPSDVPFLPKPFLSTRLVDLVCEQLGAPLKGCPRGAAA